MILLTSQKNEIYEIIVSEGLSPAQFEFRNVSNPFAGELYATELAYKESAFYFAFQTAHGNPYCTFSPGKEKMVQSEYPGNWTLQKKYFSDWLNYLSREIESDDKWERLESEISEFDFGMGSDENNNKFTFTEHEEIRVKIERIKEQVKKLEYPKEQLDRIERTLDELTESAKVLGKLDWKNLFVGTVINLIIQLAMTPSNTHAFIEIIKNIMNPILLQ